MPSNVDVKLVEHNDTDVILQWDIGKDTYAYTLDCNKNPCQYNITAEGNNVTCHISSLIPATNYNFTVYTVFSDVRSTGVNYNHTTSKWLLFLSIFSYSLDHTNNGPHSRVG